MILDEVKGLEAVFHRASWHKSCSLFFLKYIKKTLKRKQRISKQFQDIYVHPSWFAEKAKTRKWNFPRFVSKTICFVVVFLCVCFLCFFSPPFMDHQALLDSFHNMSTLPLGVEVLRHAQQLQHLLRKLSPADIVTGEAKYTKSVFLHSSGANVTCAWQMRGWNQTRRCYCLCWTIAAYIVKISEVR